MAGRLLYLDCFAGVAGDMICAALLNLGLDLDALREGLSALPISGYRLETEAVTRGPFAALRFKVLPEKVLPEFAAAQQEGHDHMHGAHDHGHGHAHDEWPGQPDRSWRTIRAMLEAADLPVRARDRAIAAFSRLAAAEARVHGVSVDEVHFHEVGAIDSIVDIVGACLAMELLDVDRVVASAPPMGSGRIHTAHGWIPVPAPATLEVLRGWPVLAGPPGRELSTPTGATLIAALAEPGDLPSMRIEAIGYGAGTRNPTDSANVLRAVLGREIAASSATEVEVIETNLDDLSGEHVPPLIEALMAAGALDVVVVPALMKKGRPGLWVQVLANLGSALPVEQALLRHGSAFGLRRHRASRRVLERSHERVATPWGEVRIKLGHLDGELLHASPEFEDVRSVAATSGVPAPRVHAAAVAAWTGR